MRWGNCSKDSIGRSIGYNFEATCDHPGCYKKIHRGLAYVCGGMHGEDEYSCEKYFCEEHRANTVLTDQKDYIDVCDECKNILLGSEEWVEDEMEGLIKRKPCY